LPDEKGKRMDSKELTAQLAQILRQRNTAALEDFVATIRAKQARATNAALVRFKIQRTAAEKRIIAHLARQQAEELHALILAIESLRWKQADVAEAVLNEAAEDFEAEHAEALDNLLADLAAQTGLDAEDACKNDIPPA